MGGDGICRRREEGGGSTWCFARIFSVAGNGGDCREAKPGSLIQSKEWDRVLDLEGISESESLKLTFLLHWPTCLLWHVWLADSQGIPAEDESCNSKTHRKKVRGEDPCGPLEVGAER